ncbi:alpha-L-rhamnosidase-related protein [Pontiella sulfatireligans]|nr:hypothetical protein [Pontiella sulfatireligans]
MPDSDQSVLLGTSGHQASNETELRYQPVEDGGFQIINGKKSYNRSITIGRNNLANGDIPLFKMHTTTGSGVYSSAVDSCFPLFSREDGAKAKVAPALGTLRLAVPSAAGLQKMDTYPSKTVFRPGYTQYEVSGPKKEWNAAITIAPTLEQHGFVCKVEFDRPMLLEWTYGDLYWSAKETNSNDVGISGCTAELTEKNLPNGVVLVGWDGNGTGTSFESKYGQSVRFSSTHKKKVYYITATWGVTQHNQALADEMMARLDTPAANAWSVERDVLKKAWFDCYIEPALNPGKKFTTLQNNPSVQLTQALEYWDERRSRFQIKTPDPYLNALVNFERCISEYHQMGPGMVLSSFKWLMYSHISVGWYGKMWAGDLAEVKNHMRFLAAMQAEDGFINWVSPSLAAYHAENNTPYWVDHVWWLYCWTGDEKFIRDLWPALKKAVEWECTNNDPDGDGLFQAKYEYWNCDSNGKGPKAATPTSTAWAMHDRAAKMAVVVGDTDAADQYRAMADRIKTKTFEELWSEEQGILGSIGANGVWRGHPQTWEQYKGINNGSIAADKGRRAMRWIESHYGFEGDSGVNMLMNCDWWPIRWSVHWVPTGDTCLAVLAGMKCGDTDLWWPYMETATLSSFRSKTPGVHFSIGNTSGGGGGGVEYIDSDDPFMHTTVRGLFGIEPEIQNDRLYITPAFPSGWETAEITTPQVSYSYQRKGERVVLKIKTPQPLVKVVSLRSGGATVTTPKEMVSTVELKRVQSKEDSMPSSTHEPILTLNNPPEKEPVLSVADKTRLVLMDLSSVYNTTLWELVTKTPFQTDYGSPTTIKGWWHTVPGKMNDGPEVISADNGIDFLLKGRPDSVAGNAGNLLALSSWGQPYPLPAAARVGVGRKVEKVWLLMQNYVSPIKNYIPNGEVILHYDSGKPDLISLIPPYNMDGYFQSFSREGTSVPLGELVWSPGWGTCNKSNCEAQAKSLAIPSDPARVLKEIEIRATVSEGVVGISAITLLPANGE